MGSHERTCYQLALVYLVLSVAGSTLVGTFTAEGRLAWLHWTWADATMASLTVAGLVILLAITFEAGYLRPNWVMVRRAGQINRVATLVTAGFAVISATLVVTVNWGANHPHSWVIWYFAPVQFAVAALFVTGALPLWAVWTYVRHAGARANPRNAQGRR